MALPTGEEEDNIYNGEHSTPRSPVAAPDEEPTAPAVTASPEAVERAREHAGEIVRMSQEVEIMATTRAKLEAALKRSEVVADILEGKMLKHVPIIKHIPLLNRLGVPVDALIGLIPVIGDAVTASAALYIVTEAHLAGVPCSEIKKMLTKIAIDSSLGAVPVVGDVFDYFYKSNNYNVEIFRKYVQEYIAKHEGTKGEVARTEDDAERRRRFEESRNI